MTDNPADPYLEYLQAFQHVRDKRDVAITTYNGRISITEEQRNAALQLELMKMEEESKGGRRLRARGKKAQEAQEAQEEQMRKLKDSSNGITLLTSPCPPVTPPHPALGANRGRNPRDPRLSKGITKEGMVNESYNLRTRKASENKEKVNKPSTSTTPIPAIPNVIAGAVTALANEIGKPSLAAFKIPKKAKDTSPMKPVNPAFTVGGGDADNEWDKPIPSSKKTPEKKKLWTPAEEMETTGGGGWDSPVPVSVPSTPVKKPVVGDDWNSGGGGWGNNTTNSSENVAVAASSNSWGESSHVETPRGEGQRGRGRGFDHGYRGNNNRDGGSRGAASDTWGTGGSQDTGENKGDAWGNDSWGNSSSSKPTKTDDAWGGGGSSSMTGNNANNGGSWGSGGGGGEDAFGWGASSSRPVSPSGSTGSGGGGWGRGGRGGGRGGRGRGGGGRGGGRPPRESQPDDWKCEGCGFATNFATRRECFKCQDPRPPGVGRDGGGRGGNRGGGGGRRGGSFSQNPNLEPVTKRPRRDSGGGGGGGWGGADEGWGSSSASASASVQQDNDDWSTSSRPAADITGSGRGSGGSKRKFGEDFTDSRGGGDRSSAGTVAAAADDWGAPPPPKSSGAPSPRSFGSSQAQGNKNTSSDDWSFPPKQSPVKKESDLPPASEDFTWRPPTTTKTITKRDQACSPPPAKVDKACSPPHMPLDAVEASLDSLITRHGRSPRGRGDRDAPVPENTLDSAIAFWPKGSRIKAPPDQRNLNRKLTMPFKNPDPNVEMFEKDTQTPRGWKTPGDSEKFPEDVVISEPGGLPLFERFAAVAQTAAGGPTAQASSSYVSPMVRIKTENIEGQYVAARTVETVPNEIIPPPTTRLKLKTWHQLKIKVEFPVLTEKGPSPDQEPEHAEQGENSLQTQSQSDVKEQGAENAVSQDGANVNPPNVSIKEERQEAGETESGGDAGETESGGDAGETESGGDAGETESGGDAGETESGGDAGETETGSDAAAVLLQSDSISIMEKQNEQELQAETSDKNGDEADTGDVVHEGSNNEGCETPSEEVIDSKKEDNVNKDNQNEGAGNGESRSENSQLDNKKPDTDDDDGWIITTPTPAESEKVNVPTTSQVSDKLTADEEGGMDNWM